MKKNNDWTALVILAENKGRTRARPRHWCWSLSSRLPRTWPT